MKQLSNLSTEELRQLAAQALQAFAATIKIVALLFVFSGVHGQIREEDKRKEIVVVESKNCCFKATTVDEYIAHSNKERAKLKLSLCSEVSQADLSAYKSRTVILVERLNVLLIAGGQRIVQSCEFFNCVELPQYENSSSSRNK